MNKSFGSVRVISGKCLSETECATLPPGSVPLGEEATEQMSDNTVNTALSLRNGSAHPIICSHGSLYPLSCNHSGSRVIALKNLLHSGDHSSSGNIDMATSLVCLPITTRSELIYKPKHPSDQTNAEPFLAAQLRTCADDPWTTDGSLLPSVCCHLQFWTTDHLRPRSLSLDHLNCLVRSSIHSHNNYTQRSTTMRSCLATYSDSHSVADTEAAVDHVTSSPHGVQFHLSDSVERKSEEDTRLAVIPPMYSSAVWWLDNNGASDGGVVNRKAVISLSASPELRPSPSFLDVKDNYNQQHLLLPGRSDFEDELVCEVAHLELSEFLIGELEYLNSVSLIRSLLDTNSCNPDPSRSPRSSTTSSMPIPVSIPESRGRAIEQSLTNFGLLTYIDPQNQMKQLSTNLRTASQQCQYRQSHNRSPFVDLFAGSIQEGRFLDDDQSNWPQSTGGRSQPNLHTMWDDEASNSSLDLLQTRFVTGLAADLVTSCMERFAGQPEPMAFLKDLHQRVMQTCDADWAFNEARGDNDCFTGPQSCKMLTNRALIPSNSAVMLTSLDRVTDSTQENTGKSTLKESCEAILAPLEQKNLEIHHGFLTSSVRLDPPASVGVPFRRGSINALCTPLPFELLTSPPVPRSKRKTIMASQRNRCAGCGAFVETRYLKRMRFCEFFGKFFCCVCHVNTLMVLPGNLLTNWDFRMLPVCNIARDRLNQLHHQPLLQFSDFNPRVVQYQTSLRNCSVLRKQGNLLLPFVRLCPNAGEPLKALKQLPQHWLDTPDLWSVADLCGVRDGQLDHRLHSALEPLVAHLSDCIRCRAQGFVCEICHSGQILFPFGQVNTVTCPSCTACFHRTCLRNPKPETCPRCVRRKQRRRLTQPGLLNALVSVAHAACESDEEQMLARV
ncbi:hypothetical protein EG68_04695 [Paragonimus skrjabini miyazakii]|uniref:Rubicon Homology domain-containing protein n=1 Tax=Paragonimus skrjabini miyazakii TaxID=59628 RepID=A0A8S9YSS7_9TREM|nr:hypothetical protein EG68_04695 [Paragonimus skrjabini miyazakii]